MTVVQTAFGGPERLLLNIVIGADNTPRLRSCELSGPEFRNRTSFKTSPELSHVLRDDVASALSEHLSWISDDAEVISLPEFLVQIPGLIISRAHILVSEMADGLRHVMCRFQHVMGSLSRMFKIDIGLGEQLFDMRERIAVEVLRDISMPLLDLCARLRAVKTNDDLGEIATHLADKSSEIGLFTEMLKRYVTDMSKERLLSPVPEVVPPLPRNLGNPGETDG